MNEINMSTERTADSLPVRSVLRLSRRISFKYGLQMADIFEFHKQYKALYPIPCVTETGAGYLWTDRYYMAYQLRDMDNPKYVYLTRTYINEEWEAYQWATKFKEYKYQLPRSILYQFVNADKYMRREKVELWIADDEL